jgi:hypothetical protein
VLGELLAGPSFLLSQDLDEFASLLGEFLADLHGTLGGLCGFGALSHTFDIHLLESRGSFPRLRLAHYHSKRNLSELSCGIKTSGQYIFE